MSEEMPIISLWAPWANWVSLGWKRIETRTHARFRCLQGRRIGIHVTNKWDDTASAHAAEYLTYEQYSTSKEFLRIGGAIICTAFVRRFDLLNQLDSRDALIDCQHIERYGLFLEDIQQIEAIPCKGKQGIWYYPLTISPEKP